MAIATIIHRLIDIILSIYILSDVDNLSEVLDDLINNQEKRIEVSVKGLKRAEDLNIIIVGKKLEDLFEVICFYDNIPLL